MSAGDYTSLEGIRISSRTCNDLPKKRGASTQELYGLEAYGILHWVTGSDESDLNRSDFGSPVWGRKEVNCGNVLSEVFDRIDDLGHGYYRIWMFGKSGLVYARAEGISVHHQYRKEYFDILKRKYDALSIIRAGGVRIRLTPSRTTTVPSHDLYFGRRGKKYIAYKPTGWYSSPPDRICASRSWDKLIKRLARTIDITPIDAELRRVYTELVGPPPIAS